MAQHKPKIYELEEKVLAYSGLELNKELNVYDVKIKLNNKDYHIHTYRCGDHNKEPIVLIHGYAGSSALYYQMLKTLSQKYQVYCMDMIGMGLSSKSTFECQTTEETLDFLTGSIEEWRKEVGLEKFNLAGHSFGGYIAGHYTLKHEDKVKKLHLLSPIGITKYEKEETVESIKERLGFWRGLLFGQFMKLWYHKVTPTSFVRNHPWIGGYFIKKYVYGTFRLKDQEAEDLKEYITGMLNLDEGSEVAIHHLLKPPMAAAHHPLEDLIATKLKIPVDCYFGDRDYMSTEGAYRLFNSGRKWNFQFKTVANAQHQLTMQNPKGLAEDLIRGAIV